MPEPSEAHRLADVTVWATCRCGRTFIRGSEAAALAAIDDHCEDPARTPAPRPNPTAVVRA